MQRRHFLGLGLATATAPFINRGRYRLFARQGTQYSKRAVDLVGSSTVIDMLSPFKLGSTTWLSRPETFTASDLQRFRDSGISIFHIATGIGGADPPKPTSCAFSRCGTASSPTITTR